MESIQDNDAETSKNAPYKYMPYKKRTRKVFDLCNDAVPVRLNLWVMLLTSCWVVYMLRVNMSMSIIAMVPLPPTNSTWRPQCTAADGAGVDNHNYTSKHVADVREAPRQVPGGGTFNWSAKEQALVLGSYFWGYPITSLIGGMAAERWGPRYVVFGTTLLSAVLTILTPAMAKFHYFAIVILRFLLGASGGFIYPSLHVLVARWAPPAEKGKFVSAMTGGTLGTVVTWTVAGPLMEKFGWESAFYVPGVLTLIWCAFWWYIVADLPSEHPRIKESEKKYITEALGDKVKKSKGLPPFKSILTSFPFLAMLVLHFGSMWGLYFIMQVGPKFISSVLGFQLTNTGLISALPYLARMFAATVFGFIGDAILSRNVMKTTTIRKLFTIFSHVLPGIMLILLVYSGCSTALSVALITLSMGFNGAATLTNLQNHQDLAPNYAGTLYGIANAAGSTTGFFTPMITAYFTRNGNGFEHWRPVFFIGASVYIVTALYFVLFGTANIQPWNSPRDDKNEDKMEMDKPKNGSIKDASDKGVEDNKVKEKF